MVSFIAAIAISYSDNVFKFTIIHLNSGTIQVSVCSYDKDFKQREDTMVPPFRLPLTTWTVRTVFKHC